MYCKFCAGEKCTHPLPMFEERPSEAQPVQVAALRAPSALAKQCRALTSVLRLPGVHRLQGQAQQAGRAHPSRVQEGGGGRSPFTLPPPLEANACR